MMIRIAITDDQLLFRQGLASLLNNAPDMQLVLEAGDGKECMERLQQLTDPPDILLMDMEMPGMNGIELNQALQKSYPAIRTIVLSVHANERLIARMIEAGACGYLVKNCDRDELLTAIKSVISTGYYINTNVLKAIQQAGAKKGKSIRSVSHIDIDISEREKEILGLICREFSNAEIAEKLYISVRTVEGHRNNLLAKTGCKNTAGLVVFALKNQLADVIL